MTDFVPVTDPRALSDVLTVLAPARSTTDPELYVARCPCCGRPGMLLGWHPGRLVPACPEACPESAIVRMLDAGRLTLIAEREAAAPTPPAPPVGARLPDPPTDLDSGDRNRGLFRFAAALRNHGLDSAEIEDHLLAVNGRLDRPLPDREIRTISRSVMRYAAPERLRESRSLPRVIQRLARRSRSPYDPGNS